MNHGISMFRVTELIEWQLKLGGGEINPLRSSLPEGILYLLCFLLLHLCAHQTMNILF